MKRHRGFTLIEMILVVSLIAVIASLLSVSLVGRLDSVRAAGAARDVASALRTTRAMALRLRAAQVLRINVEERTVTITGRKPIQLPETMEVKLYTADQEINSRREGAIRFYPDGGSTGGKVTLIVGQRTWEIAVSWLTGEISIADSASRSAR